ncbi:MAG: hypothetical protein MRY76_09405, partial [Pseudomonadales bacterium]|nr:hypothetical protein [Pseudomonadales bacterium]
AARVVMAALLSVAKPVLWGNERAQEIQKLWVWAAPIRCLPGIGKIEAKPAKIQTSTTSARAFFSAAAA